MAVAALSAPEVEYRRIRESVALVEFPGRGILHLAGPDGPEFLQGLVTNEVQKLEVGRGCPAAILTPAGKIFAMLDVFRAGADALYLLLQGGDAGRVVEYLERYRFNELVEIADLSGEIAWLSLQGPAAPSVAQGACGDDCAPEPYAFRSVSFGEHTLRAIRRDEVGTPGIHFLIRRSAAPALREVLERAALEAGGGPAGPQAWTVCRVEAGVPWQDAELDESVLPMEAGLHYLLDLDKGCYIGQEVVARATVQGRTNWSLWRLRLPPGAQIAPGQELAAGAKPRPVVRVRSVVHSPAASAPLALAFVHREVARPGPLLARSDGAEVEILLEAL